jgi:hypothetical protein
MSVSNVSPTTPAPTPEPAKAPAGTVTGASGKATTDHAVISPAGHAALDQEQGPSASPAAAAAALTQKALQLGKQLQHSDPADFTKADTNGDGKLSAAEARAAGLM